MAASAHPGHYVKDLAPSEAGTGEHQFFEQKAGRTGHFFENPIGESLLDKFPNHDTLHVQFLLKDDHTPSSMDYATVGPGE
jgi:hypothetical protein